MSGATSRPEFISPGAILESSLPKLHIAPPGQASHSVSLSGVFIGKLGEWDTFEREVAEFYQRKELQNALDACEHLSTDANLSHIEANVTRHYAGLEHTLIAEERELHGRFLNNVTQPVHAALKVMLDNKHVPKKQVAELDSLPLSADMDIGSAKIVPAERRGNKEPDIVLLMPREGKDARARIVGELKFCGTCPLSKSWGNLQSQKWLSMRHKLGQVARDMRACGVQYGFMSTYNETVYLKIVTYTNGTCALLRSKCYNADATVIYDRKENKLSRLSVRLGLAYLIHRISHGKESVWALDPRRIIQNKWVDEHTSPELGEIAAAYISPYTEHDRVPANSTGPFADEHGSAQVSPVASQGLYATPSRIPRPNGLSITSLRGSLRHLAIGSPRPEPITATLQTAMNIRQPPVDRRRRNPIFTRTVRVTRSTSRAGAAKNRDSTDETA